MSQTNDLLQSFDARDWAKAFVEHVKANPAIATDEGTMVGWFANAIMVGYDTHARRTMAAAAAPVSAIEPDELLDCVACMTPDQRAHFCTLLDPAEPDGDQGESDAGLFLKRNVEDMLAECPASSMVISGCQRVPEPGYELPAPQDMAAVLGYTANDEECGQGWIPDDPDSATPPGDQFQKVSPGPIARWIQRRIASKQLDRVEPVDEYLAIKDVVIKPADGTTSLIADVCYISGKHGIHHPVRLFQPGSSVFKELDQPTLRLTKVLAPTAIFEQFLKQYGDITRSASNHLHLSLARGHSARLEMRHCAISAIGIQLRNDEFTLVDDLVIIGTRLCRAPDNSGSQAVKAMQECWTEAFGKPLAARSPDLLPPAAVSEGLAGVLDETAHWERHAKITEHWRKLFGEDHLPVSCTYGLGTANLDAIEGILYDKEVKGIDPVRCTCGCGYVIGCGATVEVQSMEG